MMQSCSTCVISAAVRNQSSAIYAYMHDEPALPTCCMLFIFFGFCRLLQCNGNRICGLYGFCEDPAPASSTCVAPGFKTNECGEFMHRMSDMEVVCTYLILKYIPSCMAGMHSLESRRNHY